MHIILLLLRIFNLYFYTYVHVSLKLYEVWAELQRASWRGGKNLKKKTKI